MRGLSIAVAGGICALALLPGTPARGLTLEDALARAAKSRFEIAAAPIEARAGEGKVLQASVKPGPEVDLESRNVLEETSVGLSLLQERGGKRDARIAAARADLELSGAEAGVRRLEIGRQVRAAYTAVLAAEQSLKLAEEARARGRRGARAQQRQRGGWLHRARLRGGLRRKPAAPPTHAIW